MISRLPKIIAGWNRVLHKLRFRAPGLVLISAELQS